MCVSLLGYRRLDADKERRGIRDGASLGVIQEIGWFLNKMSATVGVCLKEEGVFVHGPRRHQIHESCMAGDYSC